MAPSTPTRRSIMAWKHYQAGQWQQAEQLYRQILQVDAGHVDALHLLGLIAARTGRDDLAIDYLNAALRLKPDFAEAHNNLGMPVSEAAEAGGGRGQLSAGPAASSRTMPRPTITWAMPCGAGKAGGGGGQLQQALRFKPDFAEAHNNLGISSRSRGSWRRPWPACGRPCASSRTLPRSPTTWDRALEAGAGGRRRSPAISRPCAQAGLCRGPPESRQRSQGSRPSSMRRSPPIAPRSSSSRTPPTFTVTWFCACTIIPVTTRGRSWKNAGAGTSSTPNRSKIHPAAYQSPRSRAATAHRLRLARLPRSCRSHSSRSLCCRTTITGSSKSSAMPKWHARTP